MEQRFQKGQSIVCINESGWILEGRIYNLLWSLFGIEIESNGPWNREVCVVTGYEKPHYVQLEGYGTEGYLESEFEPILEITEIEEILNAQPAEI